MNTESIVMMTLILGSVWGGFAFCIILAIKKSREKKDKYSVEGGEEG